jgi:hypothetical protein
MTFRPSEQPQHGRAVPELLSDYPPTPCGFGGHMELLTPLALAAVASALFILLLFTTESFRTFIGRLTLHWWRWRERLRTRRGPHA